MVTLWVKFSQWLYLLPVRQKWLIPIVYKEKQVSRKTARRVSAKFKWHWSNLLTHLLPLWYQLRLWSALSLLTQFSVSEVEGWAAAVRVLVVPQRKFIYELRPYYCLIVCKQEGGHREHGNALTSLPLPVSVCLPLPLSLSLSVSVSGICLRLS